MVLFLIIIKIVEIKTSWSCFGWNSIRIVRVICIAAVAVVAVWETVHVMMMSIFYESVRIVP
jgi:hypothetical protein